LGQGRGRELTERRDHRKEMRGRKSLDELKGRRVKGNGKKSRKEEDLSNVFSLYWSCVATALTVYTL